MTVTTENLYLGAFLLNEGAVLKGVMVSRSSRRTTAVFELEGESLDRRADAFHKKDAFVNLATYRDHLEALKDALFDALRQTETERRTHDLHRQGRARSPQGAR